ncbi:pyridoxamine 5'-phosphate oxidase family protein [Kitasatospora sp. NPDC048365]|uniref:pyridoxamine 5'-phosphate oxidase family protein n=1 Tax=Kitasatospora sp. NPDC048365 TaxID=3364050 RepID=UPI00371EE457
MSTATYTRNDRTTPTRSKERASWDKDAVNAILDAGYLCHLGFVADGAPVVLPTIYARVGEALYLHGSTGSRPMRGAADDEGLQVCVTVTHLDGLVLAKSAFHHSVNYRSVVAHGTAYQVTDPDELTLALNALVDQAVRGRSGDTRPANAKERAATRVIRLELDEVSAKSRTGGVNDDEDDLDLPYWAGVVPVAPAYGAPQASPHTTVPLPAYLEG